MFKSEFFKIFFAFSFVGAIIIGVIYFIDPFSEAYSEAYSAASINWEDVYESAEHDDVDCEFSQQNLDNLLSIIANDAETEIDEYIPASNTEEIIQATYEGDPSAQFDLAMRYLDSGMGVTRDDTLGFILMVILANEWDYAPAHFTLGFMFIDGIKIAHEDETKDYSPEQLLEMILAAIESRESVPIKVSFAAIGWREQNFQETFNFERARFHFQQASEQGQLLSQLCLEVMDEFGLSVVGDSYLFDELLGIMMSELSPEQLAQLEEESMRIFRIYED
jgi:TPR repeat protein